MKVTDINLLRECDKIIANIRLFRNKGLKEIREILNLGDTPEGWKLPENPTLEDEFIELYQFSGFRTISGEEEVTSYANLIRHLKEKNFVKIADEVKQCMIDFVPSEDVKTVLRKRSII